MDSLNRSPVHSRRKLFIAALAFASAVVFGLMGSFPQTSRTAVAAERPESTKVDVAARRSPGEIGVQFTTAQLMADAAAHPIDRTLAPPPVRLALPDRTNLPGNPLSPAGTTIPVDGHFSRSDAVNSPQTPGVSFDAATLSDTLAFPADPNGAVGPTQFIVTVNGKLRSYSKTTGAADGVLNLVIDNFFNSVRNGAIVQGPRIRYDRLSQRWFILDINIEVPNRVLLAVSNSSTITVGTVWTFYFFQHDLVAPTGNIGQRIDHPTLGIDANALYVGVTDFNVTTFANSTAFVINKQAALTGTLVVTAFRDLIGAEGPYVPQGVDNFDAGATEGYFIGVAKNSLGKLILRRITNPGGMSPTMSANIEITVPATAAPLNVQHAGNASGDAGYLDAMDDRLLMAQIRGGHLWTVHNVGVDNAGVAAPGTASRTGSRWYELQNLGTPPSVVQSGTLFTPSAANTLDQRSYWMGSIQVSGQGHVALGTSAAGANENINASASGRLAGDAPGTMRAATLLTNSNTGYNPNEGIPPGPRRWGRYSSTVVDPEDDMTMWTLQTYCQATSQYAVRAVQLLAPPPATPFSTSPATIAPGQASVNVTLTGTSVNGSGFFDPGPGFAKHISATVSGGVTVNSITYVSPTQIILDLNTTGAAIGKNNITVTNPDGQSSTGLGVLHTNNGFSRSAHVADFDGDARSDVGVYRPSTSIWYIAQSSAGVVGQFWGTNGDLIAPADYDGDGCTDVAIYRPSQGAWYILQSSTHTVYGALFGISEDIPVPADYDGDGKADLAVFRPSNSVWYLLQSTSGFTAYYFGLPGDVPVPGFYDTDNKADISVFRPSSGFWYRLNSGSGNSFSQFQFGQNGDKPTVGDYDGDGRSDYAFFRPSDSTWNATSSATSLPILTRQFGAMGDVAAPGDYDGDGKTDTAVYRPASGVWFIFQSASNSVIGLAFGATGDQPVEAAYIP